MRPTATKATRSDDSHPSSSSPHTQKPQNSSAPRSRRTSSIFSLASFNAILILLVALIFLPTPSHAIKFELEASHYPVQKCIWNYAHKHALIIVTANISPGNKQRVDVEVRDKESDGGANNVYLSKKNINGETRLAVTAHGEGDVGVCFKNTLDSSQKQAGRMARTVDLDVDIGADAIDYNAIANQDGLSALEVEMRKLEGVVKEIVDELGYLRDREERFADTNQSTNVRVQNFAVLTLVALIGLGVWQIFHLRAFFRRKYLID
ncbi:hypothetical protein DL93DRAFT_2125081 [Clavulina sp. PMI_390]|nr:hypothetical protein DL93DRAFT_2125081 [Clavulina sp. PMI_390]